MEKQPHILVVDDYVLNQEVTKEMLEMLGCQVDVADNGPEALVKYGENKYDLIFMDIQMPGMDGIQVANKIRKKESQGGPKTTIVALTANALEGDREKYLEQGVDDYLSKPVRLHDIEEILTKYQLR